MSIGLSKFEYDITEAVDCCRSVAYMFIEVSNAIKK